MSEEREQGMQKLNVLAAVAVGSCGPMSSVAQPPPFVLEEGLAGFLRDQHSLPLSELPARLVGRDLGTTFVVVLVALGLVGTAAVQHYSHPRRARAFVRRTLGE